MCISEDVIARHFSPADRCIHALSDVGKYKHSIFLYDGKISSGESS